MPTNIPTRPAELLGFNQPSARAALLTDALASSDAMIVSQVLHSLAKAQGQSCSLRDDPALSVVLATVKALGLDLLAEPRT